MNRAATWTLVMLALCAAAGWWGLEVRRARVGDDGWQGLPWPAASLTRVHIRRPGGVTKLERKGGEWWLAEGWRADDARVASLLDALARWRGGERVPAARVSADPASFGWSNSMIALEVATEGGAVQWELGGRAPLEGLAYARCGGTGDVWVVDDSVRGWADVDEVHWRNRRVADVSSSSAVSAWILKSPGRLVTLRRRDGGWWREGEPAVRCDSVRVETALAELVRAQAVEWAGAGERPEVGESGTGIGWVTGIATNWLWLSPPSRVGDRVAGCRSERGRVFYTTPALWKLAMSSSDEWLDHRWVPCAPDEVVSVRVRTQAQGETMLWRGGSGWKLRGADGRERVAGERPVGNALHRLTSARPEGRAAERPLQPCIWIDVETSGSLAAGPMWALELARDAHGGGWMRRAGGVGWHPVPPAWLERWESPAVHWERGNLMPHGGMARRAEWQEGGGRVVACDAQSQSGTRALAWLGEWEVVEWTGSRPGADAQPGREAGPVLRVTGSDGAVFEWRFAPRAHQGLRQVVVTPDGRVGDVLESDVEHWRAMTAADVGTER